MDSKGDRLDWMHDKEYRKPSKPFILSAEIKDPYLGEIFVGEKQKGFVALTFDIIPGHLCTSVATKWLLVKKYVWYRIDMERFI